MGIGTRLRTPVISTTTQLRRFLTGQHRLIRELESVDCMPVDQLEQISMRRLRRFLRHAFAHVPHYSEAARERGFGPNDFQTWQDLSLLPVLHKRDIREQPRKLQATSGPSRSVRPNHTGGSTSEPLRFLQDRGYRDHGRANRDRLFGWSGAEAGHPIAFLWGSPPDATEHEGTRGRLMDRWKRNWLWINTYTMTEESLRSSCEELARFGPELVVAYRSSAVLFARFMLREGLDPPPSLRGLQSSAEVLTAGDRRLLQEAFGCDVFDRYGCRETGVVAHECEAHAGLHTFPTLNIVEVVDSDDRPVPDGCSGRVLITNLTNYAMPFIRYEVGDLGVTAAGDEPCPCGRSTPRLETILGRSWDTIVTPSGRMVCGGFFEDYVLDSDCIEQFQVVQESLHHLRIDLVPRPGADIEALQSGWRDWIHETCDRDLSITFNECDRIDTGQSGKLRTAISEISHPLKFETSDTVAVTSHEDRDPVPDRRKSDNV